MVDISTPHDSSESGLEIISSEDDVRNFSSSGASTSHSESDIGSVKSSNIGNSSTSNSNFLAILLEAINNLDSVFWGALSKHS